MEKPSFNCIYCSSEHIDHPFNDLFNSSQNGWISKANPKYPIKAVIDLKGDFIFNEMQIVSHESMITTRIDIFISNNPNLNGVDINSDNFFEYKNQFNWKNIGYFGFSSNERSNWVAREFTKVALQGIQASFILLSISECYRRVPGNAYKQVSIVSLKFIGTHLYRPRFGLNMLDMYNDLVETKKAAIQEENFALADLINIQIENTKRNQDILNNLFQRKQLALENEEFLVVDSIITQILSILNQKNQPRRVVQQDQQQQQRKPQQQQQQNQRQVTQVPTTQNDNNNQKPRLLKETTPQAKSDTQTKKDDNNEPINQNKSELNTKNKKTKKTKKSKEEEEEEEDEKEEDDDKDEEEDKTDTETNNDEDEEDDGDDDEEEEEFNDKKKKSSKKAKTQKKEKPPPPSIKSTKDEDDKNKETTKKQETKTDKKTDDSEKLPSPSPSPKSPKKDNENEDEKENDKNDKNDEAKKTKDNKKPSLKSQKGKEEEEEEESSNESDNKEEEENSKTKESPINKKSPQNPSFSKTPSTPNSEEPPKNTVDPLTDEAIRESEHLIELFGEETIAMVYTENWEVKSNGLVSLCEKIKKLDNKESQNTALLSMFPILHSMFSSNMKAVYVQAVEQTMSLIDELNESETFSEKNKFPRKMVRQLMNLALPKLSNTNHRINEVSLNFVKWVSRIDKTLMIEIAQYTLKNPSQKQSTPLLDKNKLDLLITLVNENENLLTTKLNIKEVMQFFLKCLESPSKDVRTNAIKLYKICYSSYGKKVKNYIEELPKTIKKELNAAVGEKE